MNPGNPAGSTQMPRDHYEPKQQKLTCEGDLKEWNFNYLKLGFYETSYELSIVIITVIVALVLSNHIKLEGSPLSLGVLHSYATLRETEMMEGQGEQPCLFRFSGCFCDDVCTWCDIEFVLAGHRSSGPSPSTWSRWPSCPSCSWSARLGRQRPSPATTSLPWVPTVASTSSTGSTATTLRVSSTSLLWLLAVCRQYCTVTFSTSMSPKVSEMAVHQMACAKMQHLESINSWG